MSDVMNHSNLKTKNGLKASANGKNFEDDPGSQKDDELEKKEINDTPNQKSKKNVDQIHYEKPVVLTIEINLVAWLLFLIALAFRFWRLDQPRSIV